jgi:Trypsin-like peptidase domain
VGSVRLADRLVEVIADQGESAAERYRYGSGCIVRGRTVLTAAHVVAGAVKIQVRDPRKRLYSASMDPRFVGDANGSGPDLALVEIDDLAVDLDPMGLARVDRDGLTDEPVRCRAIGYPWFAETPSPTVVRDTVEAVGVVPVLSKLAAGLLSVQVSNPPRPLPPAQVSLGQSEWSGMSGAPVVAVGLLLGVVVEHAPREGPSAITAVPLTALESDPAHPGWGPGVTDPPAWWSRLGVAGVEELKLLPPPPPRLEPAYWATMREIRGRTTVLVGRERELEQIAAFAAGDDDAFGPGSTSEGYVWLVGEPWAGKTALLAQAVHTLPSNVDVVAYFLIDRESGASREQFISAVVPQLLYLLGDSAVTAGLDEFRSLWARAAVHAEDRGRHLLLVVDGLDEDPHLGGHSVAAVLPTEALGAGARVLVSSRTDMSLPNDVDIHHPLQRVSRHRIRLSAAPGTEQLRRLAEQEIKALLPRGIIETEDAKLTLDVLGMLTAAAGPLAVGDLAVLTGFKARFIRLFVTERAARSLQPVSRDGEHGYQFAHQTLLEIAREHPDVGGDPAYVQGLYAWANGWRARGWRVADTGPGPPVPRYLLDYLPALLERTGGSTRLHDLLGERHCSGERCLNVWYAAKKSAGLLEGYMADVERAWRLAMTEGEIPLQVRYALYLSSLGDTNVKVPSRLLELCLHEGVLTWQEALDSARLNRHPIRRVRAVSLLARKLAPEERERVVEAEFEFAARLDDEEQRASALLALAAVLSDRLISEVLPATDVNKAAYHRYHRDRYSAERVAVLAAYLPERDMETALRIAGSIHDPLLKVTSLGALASRPGDFQRKPLLARIRRVIARMPPTAEKVAALCELARRLERDLKQQEATVEQALVIAGGLTYSEGLTHALTALIRLGAPLVSAERLAKMLELAERAYRDEESGTDVAYIKALATLGPLLSDDQRALFVGSFVARRQSSDWRFANFARRYDSLLTPYLPREQQAAAFTKYIGSLVAIGAGEGRSFTWGNEWRPRAALNALEQLPEELLDTALEAVDKIHTDIWRSEIEVVEGRADVLATLVPRLPPERRGSVLRRELDRVGGINDNEAQARALAALAAHSPEQTRARLAEAALKNAQAMPRYERYFEVVASLAPHLQPDRTATVLNEAFDDARAVDDARSRAKALVELIPSLPEAKIPEARESVETLGDDAYLALAPLATRLPVEQRSEAISRVLHAVQGVVIAELPQDLVAVLRPIAPYLEGAQSVTALDLAGEISNHRESLQADALAILAPRLSNEERDRALSRVNYLQDDLSYIRAVAALARSLDEPERAAWLREAQDTANRLHDNEARVRALVALAPLLGKPRTVLSEALALAMTIAEDQQRARTLSFLLPQLDGAERRTAFDKMLRSCLGSRVARIVSGTVVREGLDRAFLLERIADVAGVLAGHGGQDTAAETARAVRETASAWP